MRISFQSSSIRITWVSIGIVMERIGNGLYTKIKSLLYLNHSAIRLRLGLVGGLVRQQAQPKHIAM